MQQVQKLQGMLAASENAQARQQAIQPRQQMHSFLVRLLLDYGAVVCPAGAFKDRIQFTRRLVLNDNAGDMDGPSYSSSMS